VGEEDKEEEASLEWVARGSGLSCVWMAKWGCNGSGKSVGFGGRDWRCGMGKHMTRAGDDNVFVRCGGRDRLYCWLSGRVGRVSSLGGGIVPSRATAPRWAPMGVGD